MSTTTKLRWCRAHLLANLPHAMFCRHGGVSRPPFASLNLSFGVGDRSKDVTVNRRLVKECLGITHLVSAVQVHGDRVVLVEAVRRDREYEGADALVTNQPKVGLLIQQADCQAVLLYDPVRKVIAAAHNGWKGSVLNIIAATVRTMQAYFGTDPADLRAVISPSLGPCCAEFVNWRLELPASLHQYQVRPNYFDFWAVSREQLTAAGVMSKQIETAGICTACNHNFFSYRRAVKRQGKPGATGRCGAVLML